MTKFTDGARVVAISIYEEGKPDFSSDFFEVGGLPYDEESDTYAVEDVNYLREQAEDWKNGNGDFLDERMEREENGMEFDPDDRHVDVEEICDLRVKAIELLKELDKVVKQASPGTTYWAAGLTNGTLSLNNEDPRRKPEGRYASFDIGLYPDGLYDFIHEEDVK